MFKKIISCVLICVLICSLFVGCANGNNATNPDDNHTTAPIVDPTIPSKPEPTEKPTDGSVLLPGKDDPSNVLDCETKVVYANWSDDEKIKTTAINAAALASGEKQLPMYRLDTREDIDAFKTRFAGCFSFNHGYGGTSHFDAAMADYDEEFFANNSLILVYVTAGSGSLRFGVRDVLYNNQSLTVYVEQTNNPEVGTCDMAGWFMIVEISDDILNNCVEFEARKVSTLPPIND